MPLNGQVMVFMIFKKGVSVMDGQPKCVGGANIFLKISFLSC